MSELDELRATRDSLIRELLAVREQKIITLEENIAMQKKTIELQDEIIERLNNQIHQILVVKKS